MVNGDELDREITELIERFLDEAVGHPGLPVDDGTDLVSDLMLDSLDFVALLSELEERWDLRIPDEDASIQSFATVGAVRAYVRRALGAADQHSRPHERA